MKLSAILFLSLFFVSCIAAQSRGDRIPEEMIGKWYLSAISNTTYSDRGTGANNTASGNNASFEFKADGTFVLARFARAQVYGCVTEIYNYNPGKFRIEEDIIYFMPTDDELSYKASCSPSLNSVKHKKPINSSNKFAFKTEDNIAYLCFTDEKGNEGCWRRMNG